MVIGTMKVQTMSGAEIFTQDVNNITVSGGRVFIQTEGTFIPKLPFSKNSIYKLIVQNVQGMESPLLVAFEDYIFNAGSTETVTLDGERTVGVCILSNQLQFLLIEE